MNKENVQKAINVMQRVIDNQAKFSIIDYQVTPTGVIAKDEKQLIECGSVACFSGWLAVSPEWKEFGGVVHKRNGSAVTYNENPDSSIIYNSTVESIAKFFDISEEKVHCIIFPGFTNRDELYNKSAKDIVPQDVIDVLTKLMNEESNIDE